MTCSNMRSRYREISCLSFNTDINRVRNQGDIKKLVMRECRIFQSVLFCDILNFLSQLKNRLTNGNFRIRLIHLLSAQKKVINLFPEFSGKPIDHLIKFKAWFIVLIHSSNITMCNYHFVIVQKTFFKFIKLFSFQFLNQHIRLI